MPVATEATALTLRRDSDPASAYADFASAFDRGEALGLELRGEDGRVIETEWIAIRDTEMILTGLSDDEPGFEDSAFTFDPELEAAIEHDAVLISEWFGNDREDFDLDADERADWMDPSEYPRYQVLVELRDRARSG